MTRGREAEAGARRRNMAPAYLSDSEKRAVADRAAQLNLPVSAFLRRLALGAPLPDPSAFAAHDAVRDLLAVNADLARLGNLLKPEIDAVDGAAPRRFVEDVDGLHAGIRETQDRLKACAVAVADSVRPGRRGAGHDREEGREGGGRPG